MFELDREHGRWNGFRPRATIPHVEALGGRAQWIDLDGDGRDDLVVARADGFLSSWTMNALAILNQYAPGDPEARLLVAAARQIEEALRGRVPWSIALGVELRSLLINHGRLKFPDGTILNEPSLYESIIGDWEAALILAALDPAGHDSAWWRHYRDVDSESPEREQVARQLMDALVAVGAELEQLPHRRQR